MQYLRAKSAPGSTMTQPNQPDWPRNYFENTGRNAELFFLVVGPAPEQPLKLSQKRHHITRIEPQLVIPPHERDEAPDWFEGWFAPPLGTELEGLFLNPDEVRAATHMTSVRG